MSMLPGLPGFASNHDVAYTIVPRPVCALSRPRYFRRSRSCGLGSPGTTFGLFLTTAFSSWTNWPQVGIDQPRCTGTGDVVLATTTDGSQGVATATVYALA